MTTPSNNADFDALIDLLGFDDDDSVRGEKGNLFRADPLTHETSGPEEIKSSSSTLLPSFDSGNSLELDNSRQYTPANVPQLDNRLSPLPPGSYAQAEFPGIPSPKPAELQMPAFPPLTPTLRSVRSTNDIPTMGLEFGIPNHAVELLPVSPFLLSPQSFGLDQTRSPFFSGIPLTNDGSPLPDPRTILSVTTSPVATSPLRHPVLPNEEVGPGVEEREESQGVLYESSPAVHRSINISTRLASPAMERLARELSLARAEITSLRGQCDELRLLVTNNGLRGVPEAPKSSRPREDHGVPERVEATTPRRMARIERPQSIFDGDREDVDLTPTEAEKPEVPHPSSSDAVGGGWDDIDNMSGDDARQALKSILSYFSLPSSSLQTLPPLHRPVGHDVIINPSPRSNLVQSSSSHAISGPLPPPSTFAQVKRAVTFLVHADELVWKRASLSNRRHPLRRAHPHPHLTPLTSSPQSDSSVQAPGLSPIRKTGEQTSSNPGAGAVPGNDSGTGQNTSIIFEENNVKALEDRLSLWEKAVRTKMSRPKR